ncbi:MAG TPA: hypothetical protein VGG28_22240 [Kofleriaceae bacterium]|jgi:hypothetical protein
MRRIYAYAGVGFGGLVILAIALGRPNPAAPSAGSGSAALDDALPVTAVDLDAAYRANEVRADSLYLHKVVHVSGVVDKISKDLADHAVVTLRTEGSKGITCTFAVADPLLLDLDRESRVTLHGNGNGYLFHGVMLDNCHVDAVHGPACEVWDSSSGQTLRGECTRTCSGVVYHGYCDGPSDVVCCTPPVAAKGSAIGPLERATGSN